MWYLIKRNIVILFLDSKILDVLDCLKPMLVGPIVARYKNCRLFIVTAGCISTAEQIYSIRHTI